ncbi:hypothetical protein ACFLY6_00885 [Candidatus Dependentiae bacterium]
MSEHEHEAAFPIQSSFVSMEKGLYGGVLCITCKKEIDIKNDHCAWSLSDCFGILWVHGNCMKEFCESHTCNSVVENAKIKDVKVPTWFVFFDNEIHCESQKELEEAIPENSWQDYVSPEIFSEHMIVEVHQATIGRGTDIKFMAIEKVSVGLISTYKGLQYNSRIKIPKFCGKSEGANGMLCCICKKSADDITRTAIRSTNPIGALWFHLDCLSTFGSCPPGEALRKAARDLREKTIYQAKLTVFVGKTLRCYSEQSLCKEQTTPFPINEIHSFFPNHIIDIIRPCITKDGYKFNWVEIYQDGELMHRGLEEKVRSHQPKR